MALRNNWRSLVVVAAGSLAIATLGAPTAQASPHRWVVDVGEQPTTVRAVYPTVTVPSDTNLLAISLPTQFDWSPADINAPAPTVTYSIESAGVVVGASDEPPAPDADTLPAFGTSASIDFSTLPTDPPVGTGYTLHIHAVWDPTAPLDAGDVVELVAPFDVTSGGGGNVPFDLALTNATTETRTVSTALDGQPNAGDTVQLTTANAESPWNWITGPDTTSPWTTRAQIYAGLGVGSVDLSNPDQELSGPFSISTPDPTLLIAPLPDVVYAGASSMALSVSSKDAPATGPVVTFVVNVDLTFAGGASALAAAPGPIIGGSGTVGHTLSVTTGTWAPVSAGSWATGSITFDIRWYRGTIAIPGATGPTYLLTAADVGKVVSARVTATSPGYLSTTVATPGRTVKPGSAPRATVRPTLLGSAVAGRLISVRHGSWTPAPSSYRYQWLNNGSAIRGATATSYRMPTSMRGHTISCRILALKTGYLTGTATTIAPRVR